jgi:SprT protein
VATIEEVLAKYLPAPAVSVCTRWIVSRNIHLRITGNRTSKLGDYRPLGPGKGHRITVNHDLNPFAFLITFTHEVAHLHCFMQYGPRHDAHGREWKREFKTLLGHFLGKGIFPDELECILKRHLEDPPSSSCHDVELTKALKRYNPSHSTPILHLDELPDRTVFRLHGERSKMIFTKGLRNRTRYRCLEHSSGKEYLVSSIAEVEPLSESEPTF